MSLYTTGRMRQDAATIFQAALQAVDARQCVRRFVALRDGALTVGDRAYDLARYRRLLVVGAGKASPRMALALEAILGDRIETGLINTKYGHGEALTSIRVSECGHPVPDEAGVAATERMLALLQGADADTLVVCLVSGGGSALTPAPAEGLTLAQKQQTTRLLLECGANIVELNAVRKHLSRVKGGGLARAASPATVVSLMLSDVIGDPMDVIASGPTTPDPSTFGDCVEILRRYGLRDRVPPPVLMRLEAGVRGEIPETPKPGDPVLALCHNVVVGSNALAVHAAAERARELGYHVTVLSARVEGEARTVGRVYAAIGQEIRTSGRPVATPGCAIAGGETTVTVSGSGKGGRNQELVLAGAMHLAGWPNIVLFSAGTDGTDGPTDAAGAIGDGQTVPRAAALGLSAADHLRNNDSYAFFKPLGDLVMTGPTGTNVADVALVLVGDSTP